MFEDPSPSSYHLVERLMLRERRLNGEDKSCKTWRFLWVSGGILKMMKLAPLGSVNSDDEQV